MWNGGFEGWDGHKYIQLRLPHQINVAYVHDTFSFRSKAEFLYLNYRGCMYYLS